MSVQAQDLFLGQGELFIKRENDTSGKYRRIGSLKGNVTFHYEMETVEQVPGNRLTAVARYKTGEKASLSGTLCDVKMSQLIPALGLSISTTQLTATSTLRVFEEIAFTSITNTRTLGNPAQSMTSIVVTGMDGRLYVKATDYSLPTKSGVKPILASFAWGTRIVAYDYTDVSAPTIKIGDKLTLQVVDLKFTAKIRATGKHITIEIPRATVVGGLEIPFSNSEFSTYQVMFNALGEPTAAPGSSLFKIIREA